MVLAGFCLLGLLACLLPWLLDCGIKALTPRAGQPRLGKVRRSGRLPGPTPAHGPRATQSLAGASGAGPAPPFAPPTHGQHRDLRHAALNPRDDLRGVVERQGPSPGCHLQAASRPAGATRSVPGSRQRRRLPPPVFCRPRDAPRHPTRPPEHKATTALPAARGWPMLRAPTGNQPPARPPRARAPLSRPHLVRALVEKGAAAGPDLRVALLPRFVVHHAALAQLPGGLGRGVGEGGGAREGGRRAFANAGTPAAPSARGSGVDARMRAVRSTGGTKLVIRGTRVSLTTRRASAVAFPGPRQQAAPAATPAAGEAPRARLGGPWAAAAPWPLCGRTPRRLGSAYTGRRAASRKGAPPHRATPPGARPAGARRRGVCARARRGVSAGFGGGRMRGRAESGSRGKAGGSSRQDGWRRRTSVSV